MKNFIINFRPASGYILVRENHGNREIWRYEKDYRFHPTSASSASWATLAFVVMLLLTLAIHAKHKNNATLPKEKLVVSQSVNPHP